MLQKKKIEFLSSGDIDSVLFLRKLRMKRYKIPSGEINNLPLLEKYLNLEEGTIIYWYE